MPKATKPLGDQTVETTDQTDNQTVNTGSQQTDQGTDADASKQDLADTQEKLEKAKLELASVTEGRKAEEKKLAKIREDQRLERASRGSYTDEQVVEQLTQSPQPASIIAPNAQDDDFSSVEGWQRHIDKTTEQKLQPIISDIKSFKQASRKKALQEFMSHHPEYRGDNEEKLKELVSVAERNGLKDTFHAEESLKILEGSWAFLNQDYILARARATEVAGAEAEDAALDAASTGSVGRESSGGGTVPQATKSDINAARFAKMPVEKYLKLKKQATEQGFFVESPTS